MKGEQQEKVSMLGDTQQKVVLKQKEDIQAPRNVNHLIAKQKDGELAEFGFNILLFSSD